MFSDAVFDSLQQILDAIRPDSAFINVYPKGDVINMLTHMYFVIALSDARLPNGNLTRSKAEIFQISRESAIREYETRMM